MVMWMYEFERLYEEIREAGLNRRHNNDPIDVDPVPGPLTPRPGSGILILSH